MKKILLAWCFIFVCAINLKAQSIVYEDTSLIKSIQFLKGKRGDFEPVYLNIFINLFEKKYAIKFDGDLSRLKKEFENIDFYKDSGPLYARLIGVPPSIVSEKLIDSLHQRYDSLMLRSLYADQLQLKVNVYRKLFKTRYKDPSPYSISHSLFALAWLKELNYLPKFTDKKLNKFSKKAIYILNNQKCSNLDEFAEMAAILSYLGYGNKYCLVWKNTIINLQNEDGSWGNELNQKTITNDHCTIFATWFLLQLNTNPRNQELNWIKLTK